MKRLGLLLALAAFGATSATACMCGRISTAAESLAQSPAVFEGVVIEKRAVFGSEEGWFYPVEEYTFAVTKSWKGVSSPYVVLRQGPSNCDERFSGGVAYLVYAAPDPDEPATFGAGKCWPTKQSAAAEADRAALGPPIASFALARQPWRRLPAGYFVRLYWIAGLTAHVNVIRHPRVAAEWPAAGWVIFGDAVVVLGLITAAAVVLRRSRRLAMVLMLSAVLCAVLSVTLSGAYFLRRSYFDSFRTWGKDG